MEISVFPLDRSPGHIIHRLDTVLAAGLHREFQNHGYDLTPEQWGVLSRLWEADGIHQAELAQRAFKDRHNITRILQLLEKNGSIVRRDDPDDKRRQNVFLTGQGKRLQSELTPIVVNYLEKILAGLDGDDLKTMKRIHEHMIRNAESL